MLSLLLELLVSIALCVALAYFALLNVPVDVEEPESTASTSVSEGVYAMSGADPRGTFLGAGIEGAEYGHMYGPLLLPPHELPLYTTITRCASLAEDTTLGAVYRWLLINGLHYSPREVYSERRLRERGCYASDGAGRLIGGRDVDDNMSGADMQGNEHFSAAGSVSFASAGSAKTTRINFGGRSRRRQRRCALAAAPPTPLRRESAHWVNVLIRCGAFLCLGGGTVNPEIWTDHLLYGAEKVLASVNADYENRMRARATEAGGMVTQLASTAQASRLLTAPRNPLLRIQLLELGSGLLGGAPREVRHPPLSLHHGAGDALGNSPIPPRAAPPARQVAAVATAGSPGMVATAPGSAYHHRHSSNAAISGNSQQMSTRIALDTTSSFLSSSVAGLSTAIADAVSSVTTCGADSARLGEAVSGASIVEYPGSGPLFTGGAGGTSSAGAQLGVVLPRVEGDVVSVEQAYSGVVQKTPPAPAAHAASAAASAPGPSSLLPQTPATLPLRCFAVPLLYEDQRFHVRLGCCLPLGALLPASLCVPPDVLTLNCAVAVHRVTFTGHLYAAFHGSRVELSFPTAPLFTAVVKVMPDTNDASGVGGSVAEVSDHGGLGIRAGSSSGVHSGAAAATAFTATYTTRNEATAVGGGGIDGECHVYNAAARPPPPLRPRMYGISSSAAFHRHHHHRSGMSGGGGGGGGASRSGSCVNESNEKVQEVVLLAVHRLVQSLTYPKVLVGELVCRRASEGDGTAEGGAEKQLQLKWTRQTASLPLRM
ncbi:hypothetical protein GH5_07209 [Leishmania sp. Ghana 2012 LV757]|uniref:hypothetical protein n=1 Tax=Leishmania sp. Ghana 2012 LV757 TaxID=2803181 RepID=UPI001B672762|nr:hypothetical protein GH5_07209 [Leishmania sp. Ghana 2012 LV757]